MHPPTLLPSCLVSSSHFNALIYFLFVCLFLVSYLQHVEVPWLGVESAIQLWAYAKARATPDLSCICDLQHSSQQFWLLNPLSKSGIKPTTSWFLAGFANH